MEAERRLGRLGGVGISSPTWTREAALIWECVVWVALLHCCHGPLIKPLCVVLDEKSRHARVH